ncbi:hypothetical protein BO94DRAFT_6656 [Aspergillus sclerotioniger CBS 115572]|uniref:Uncharacterized protein n=1 Tax=Aspergillus sclerotioniger CBS 115572 TaxID=1450535 RepID=A0A317XF25_9EURO|nr:hypothetical protein BO94DRAFT_6656 [Aspergillus sclerotioniger CBS 115572]PWY96337.1 hypothetical protein BO94DRAFT_6656 [Aspergillus sclerotioniger CBS 115572]
MWHKKERASVVFHEEAGCCVRIRDGGGEVDEERDKKRTGSWCLEGEPRRQNHFRKIDSVEVGSLACLGLIYCTGPHWYVVRVERPLGRGFSRWTLESWTGGWKKSHQPRLTVHGIRESG